MKIYFHLSPDGFSNCYVVTNPFSNEAIIVDPGVINKEIISQIEDNHYNLVAVLITHHHSSHVRGLSTIRKIYSPKVYAADSEVARSDTVVLSGDGITKIAGLTVNYYSIPGHSADSLAFKIGSVIFTGDAITSGLIGDTPNSFTERNMKSIIEKKIFSQNPDIVLMPGHGPPSCIGAEKKFNLGFAKQDESFRVQVRNFQEDNSETV